MATQDMQEMQEMLEGMLNDEQTAEVLHRLSVSPEKLSAFRQHMALRRAIEQDARFGALDDKEDNVVWAAILGATGGLVTGGALVRASGWLAKAAALVVAGLAGFFIGTAVDGTLFTPDEATLADNSTQQIQENSLQAAIPVSSIEPGRVDTVVQTVIEYHDRIKYKYVDRDPAIVQAPGPAPQDTDIQAADSESSAVLPKTVSFKAIHDLSAKSTPVSPNHYGVSLDAIAALQALSTNDLNGNPSNRIAEITSLSSHSPIVIVPNPNEFLDQKTSNLSAGNRSPKVKEDDPSLEKSSTVISLMRNGFEVGYNERLGRVTPPPTVRDNSEPNFGGRSIDLTWRSLNGSTGLGARLIYGTFSTVKLSEKIWDRLRVADTLLVPSLKSSREFNVEVFANYRLPLFSDRFALSLEGSFGLSSTRFQVGGDLSVLYLMTNWLGAQGGIGYGGYRYTTQQERENALKNYENVAITDDFIDAYSGTLLEGRYGLFFRF
ncbi:MAG: hypothetical protein J4G05_02065 [Chlorobi bacterium]|nr:hypothetical protein [Chlorobiota bacterium]